MPKLVRPLKAAPEPVEATEAAEGTDTPAEPPKAKGKARTGQTKQAAPAPRLLAGTRKLADLADTTAGLWCGDQGTGKTTSVLTMANLGRVLLVNAEGGAKKRALARRGINVDNIEVLPQDPADLTYQYLKDLAWEIKSDLAKDPTSWVGGVWDSITDIHARILRNVVNYQNELASGRGESRIKNATPGDELNEFFTDLSDYGVMAKQMVELLKLWHDIPWHFAITSLLRRDKDSDGAVLYRPAVTPALQGELLGLVDIVCVTSVQEVPGGEDEYRGLFRPAGKYQGKDREGVLPKRLLDPTFERVRAYVTEELDVESDDVMLAAKKRRSQQVESEIEKQVEGSDDEQPEDEPGDVEAAE